MKLSQEQIDRIYKISDWCVKGIILIGLVVIFLKPGNWFWWIFFILLLISILVNVISKHWATDEETAEFKKTVKEAVREVTDEQPMPTIIPVHEVYDPFAAEISDEQKEEVKQILHDLPSHHEKKYCINMSEVSRYLTALVDLKIISPSKSADVNSLRTWVEQVTGKQAPKQFHFNDAFPSGNKTGVKKAKEKIKKILDI